MSAVRFVAIPIDSFIGGSKAIVDLYICLGSDHYIKIVKAGNAFDLDRFKTFKDKEVKTLYVKRDDFKIFTQHSARITEIVSSRSPATTKQKLGLLLRTADHVFTEIADFGVNEHSFNHAAQVCQSTLAIVGNNPSLIDVLDELSKYNQDFCRHSIGTSVLSVMMVQALKWHAKKTMSFAALGGLLHDIGLREMDPKLLSKTRSEMTKEELELYESHPIRGMMMLAGLKSIPPEVIAIVSEHHELPSGTGFPRGIRGDKIYPLARVVSFSDHLAEHLIKSDKNPYPKSLKDTLLYLHHTMRHDFPGIYFDAAKRLNRLGEQKATA